MTQHSGKRYEGRALTKGSALGQALQLTEPLSFWGGMDVASGKIIDQHHPQIGASVTGKVLIMPAGRGSSSSSSVLAEAIYAGTAPAAIILSDVDVIVALGAMVAQELYSLSCPVVVIDGAVQLSNSSILSVDATNEEATVECMASRDAMHLADDSSHS